MGSDEGSGGEVECYDFDDDIIVHEDVDDGGFESLLAAEFAQQQERKPCADCKAYFSLKALNEDGLCERCVFFRRMNEEWKRWAEMEIDLSALSTGGTPDTTTTGTPSVEERSPKKVHFADENNGVLVFEIRSPTSTSSSSSTSDSPKTSPRPPSPPPRLTSPPLSDDSPLPESPADPSESPVSSIKHPTNFVDQLAMAV